MSTTGAKDLIRLAIGRGWCRKLNWLGRSLARLDGNTATVFGSDKSWFADAALDAHPVADNSLRVLASEIAVSIAAAEDLIHLALGRVWARELNWLRGSLARLEGNTATVLGSDKTVLAEAPGDEIQGTDTRIWPLASRGASRSVTVINFVFLALGLRSRDGKERREGENGGDQGQERGVATTDERHLDGMERKQWVKWEICRKKSALNIELL